MSPLWAAALVAGVGLILSVSSSLVIVGVAWGKLRADVDALKASEQKLATKDQVESLGRDVAEIKGMFRVTLKSEHGGTE